jgi:hypothetical protein
MSLPIVSKQGFHLFSPSTGLFLGVQQKRLVLSRNQTTWKIINNILCEDQNLKCLNYNLNLEDKSGINIEITLHENEFYFVECMQTKETIAFDNTTGLHWSKDVAIPFKIIQPEPQQATFQPKQQDLASLMLELQNTKAALQVCQTKNKKKGCCIS